MARNASTKSTWNQYKSELDRPTEPFKQAPHADRQGDISDDDYYTQNPWYGHPKKQAVFGLGKPLPHKVRYQKKKPTPFRKTQKVKDSDRDVEKGLKALWRAKLGWRKKSKEQISWPMGDGLGATRAMAAVEEGAERLKGMAEQARVEGREARVEQIALRVRDLVHSLEE